MDKDITLENVKALSNSEKKEIAISAAQDFNEEEKEAVAEAILGQPTQRTTNRLWMIIVCSFALGFILSIGAMVYSAVIGREIADKLITVFTTMSAFLAGLIAPSPVKK